MRPDPSVIKSGLPEKGRAHALVEAGRQYAIYLFDGPQAELGIDLAAGNYDVRWISPLTGETLKSAALKHGGGIATLNSPAYNPDIALRVMKMD
jgi:hypothetical protein